MAFNNFVSVERNRYHINNTLKTLTISLEFPVSRESSQILINKLGQFDLIFKKKRIWVIIFFLWLSRVLAHCTPSSSKRQLAFSSYLHCQQLCSSQLSFETNSDDLA